MLPPCLNLTCLKKKKSITRVISDQLFLCVENLCLMFVCYIYIYVSRLILRILTIFAVSWLFCGVGGRWFDAGFQPCCGLGLKAPTIYLSLLSLLHRTKQRDPKEKSNAVAALCRRRVGNQRRKAGKEGGAVQGGSHCVPLLCDRCEMGRTNSRRVPLNAWSNLFPGPRVVQHCPRPLVQGWPSHPGPVRDTGGHRCAADLFPL